jgi:PAS domain S-box-containing protein
MQDTLDLAERLATDGQLLARPGLPEIVALRDWACEQVLAQLGGAPPAPWPGTDHERFLAQDAVGTAGEGVEVVRSSSRPAVAADDSNRIVAVSRAMAAATGWEVDDLVGRRIVTLIPPRLREGHVAGFSRHLSTGEARLLGVPLELPVLRADGTEVRCGVLIEEAATEHGPPAVPGLVRPAPRLTGAPRCDLGRLGSQAELQPDRDPRPCGPWLTPHRVARAPHDGQPPPALVLEGAGRDVVAGGGIDVLLAGPETLDGCVAAVVDLDPQGRVRGGAQHEGHLSGTVPDRVGHQLARGQQGGVEDLLVPPAGGAP